ncbi:unnamed protein product [Nyctereutes procyonoides]|uniref:(raccoon dog) hypothetical protein n=1 Tax=Nyctereutes procyonoides TaxID=34880 RepID=A0A811YF00_NYCPR|nr:unnamed protein product [Nyctereutes procyonoides]
MGGSEEKYSHLLSVAGIICPPCMGLGKYRVYSSAQITWIELVAGGVWRQMGHRDTWRGRSCEDGGRDWSYAATSQGTPEATSHWKRQGKILSWRLWRECGPADTLILFCFVFNLKFKNLKI